MKEVPGNVTLHCRDAVPIRKDRVKDILLEYQRGGGSTLGLARTGALDLAQPAREERPSPAAVISEEPEEIDADDYEEEDDDDEPVALPPKEKKDKKEKKGMKAAKEKTCRWTPRS